MPTSAFYAIGEAFIETFMSDSCVITRDQIGILDDVLDEDTGELVSPGGTSSTIYTGICIIKPVASRDMEYNQGKQPVFRKVYVALIPKSADEVFEGDTLTVSSSTKDASLTGESFRVMESHLSTNSVYRYLRVEDVRQDFNATNPMT